MVDHQLFCDEYPHIQWLLPYLTPSQPRSLSRHSYRYFVFFVHRKTIFLLFPSHMQHGPQSVVQCDWENIRIVWPHFSWIYRYLSIDLCFSITIYPSCYLSTCLKRRHTILIFSKSQCTFFFSFEATSYLFPFRWEIFSWSSLCIG